MRLSDSAGSDRRRAAGATRYARPARPARRGAALAALATGLALLAGSLPAQAEGRLRIAEQFGIVYLLLNVAQDQKLIEKHAKAAGVDAKVEWVKLSGGSAINDALLSGNIEVGGAGVGPLLTLWDRTRGRQNVKGVASLGNFPYYLVTNNPAVKSIADFTDRDRIAVPAVGVSVQSRMLQLASAKRWGERAFDRLDRLTVAMPHPEATAAIVKGGTEITGHFANPPFQDQALAANPGVRVVLNSYEVMGGPSSATVLYATEKFRSDNPRTYRALLDALDEAARLVTADPEKAADIYLRVSGARIDRELLLKVIRNPEVKFTTVPQNTFPLADFMHRVGAIRHRPASERDYFFDDARGVAGS